MSEEREHKRINVLIPVELFNKFQEFSSQEYKNTTAMIVDWMVQYVTEKEKANNKTRSFFATAIRLTKGSRSLEQLSGNMCRELLQELNSLWEQLQKDPGIGDSPDFKAELIALERKIKANSPEPYMDDIPF